MSRRLLCASALGALAVAAAIPVGSATAGDSTARTSATPGTVYGGGHPPPNYRRGDSRSASMLSFEVAPDGQSARYSAALRGRCGSRFFGGRAPLAADGTLQVSGTSRERFGGGLAIVSYALTGRLDAVSGAGEVRGRFTFRRNGRTSRCSVAAPWQVRAGAPDPNAPGARATGALYGTTSQRIRSVPAPLTTRVSADGQRVLVGTTVLRTRCRRGGRTTGYSFPGARIGADGSFRSVERLTVRFPGGRDRFVATFAGRVGAQGAVGTVSLTVVSRSRGRVIDRCRTGTVQWTARA